MLRIFWRFPHSRIGRILLGSGYYKNYLVILNVDDLIVLVKIQCDTKGNVLTKYIVKNPKKNKNGVSHVWGAKASARVITKGNMISTETNSEYVKLDWKKIIIMILVIKTHALPSTVLSYFIFEKRA